MEIDCPIVNIQQCQTSESHFLIGYYVGLFFGFSCVLNFQLVHHENASLNLTLLLFFISFLIASSASPGSQKTFSFFLIYFSKHGQNHLDQRSFISDSSFICSLFRVFGNRLIPVFIQEFLILISRVLHFGFICGYLSFPFVNHEYAPLVLVLLLFVSLFLQFFLVFILRPLFLYLLDFSKHRQKVVFFIVCVVLSHSDSLSFLFYNFSF